SVTSCPLTSTAPEVIRFSAARREVIPAAAIIFCRRSKAIPEKVISKTFVRPPWLLEMVRQLREPVHDYQPAWRVRLSHFLVLEDPGVIVRNKYRIKPSRERWIDIRLGAVADHPRLFRHEIMLAHDRAIFVCVFLRHNLHGGKKFLQAGAFHFS